MSCQRRGVRPSSAAFARGLSCRAVAKRQRTGTLQNLAATGPAHGQPPLLFETHWDHEPKRGCVQSTSHRASAGQSPSNRSIALSVAPPLRLLLWTYVFSVRVLSPWDVAPTFLSAGWEAFQPPVARQECLATCRLESRRYELSGRSTHTLDTAALQRRGSWEGRFIVFCFITGWIILKSAWR